MKLVCMADNHGIYDGPEIPDGDVFIHAGDFSKFGCAEEAHQFACWLDDLPHKRKIAVLGNHDRFAEERPMGFLQLMRSTGVNVLKDTSCMIDDVLFFGSPYTPEFCNWSFMYTRGQGHEHWNKIPAGTNVLITHGPPYGVLDQVPVWAEDSPWVRSHVGCKELRDRVQELQNVKNYPHHMDLKLHVFGHIHECGGQVEPGGYGETTFANVSLLRTDGTIGKPLVIEI